MLERGEFTLLDKYSLLETITPLVSAIFTRSRIMVSKIIEFAKKNYGEKSIEFDSILNYNFKGLSLLSLAVTENCVGIAKLLLDTGVIIINKRSEGDMNMGRTALLIAASRQHVEMTRLLLEYNANPFMEDNNYDSDLKLVRSNEMGSLFENYSYYNQICARCDIKETKDLRMKVCSRCEIACYCGSKCQTEHWEFDHKHCCQSPIILNLQKEDYIVRKEALKDNRIYYAKATVCVAADNIAKIIIDRNGSIYSHIVIQTAFNRSQVILHYNSIFTSLFKLMEKGKKSSDDTGACYTRYFFMKVKENEIKIYTGMNVEKCMQW